MGASRVSLSAILLWAASTPLLAFWLREPAYFTNGLSPRQLGYVAAALALSIAVLPLRFEGVRHPFTVHSLGSTLATCAFIVLGTIAIDFAATRLEGVPRLVPLIHFLLLAAGAVALTYRRPDGPADGEGPPPLGPPERPPSGPTVPGPIRAALSRLFFWDKKAPLASAGEWLAVIAFILLPWTTSGTAIALGIWIVVALPVLTRREAGDILPRAAAYLPVALWGVMVAGMFWADSSWADSLRALKSFHKLLALPLFMIFFSRSDRGLFAFGAFVASSVVLLAYSWASWWWPTLIIATDTPGIPVKDHIFQGVNFVLSASVLIYLVFSALRRRAFVVAGLLAALVGFFLLNLVFVAVSRTTLIALPILLAVIGYSQFRFLGGTALLAAFAVACVVAWETSPYFHSRVAPLVEFVTEAKLPQDHPDALRLRFWAVALDAARAHPLLGMGTGSTQRLFADARVIDGKPASGVGINNPHNQTLAVALQTGALGVAILYLMWLSHILLFFGEGWAARLGMLAVVQNIATSIFNSHISDYTSGWLYVMVVGALGGTILRQRWQSLQTPMIQCRARRRAF